MKKIFFFDIDGTLAIRGKIPQNHITALQLLKDKGYLTFICTGRAVYYAKNLFGDLVSGYIACNGRYISYLNQKLHGENFSKEEIEHYKKKFKKLNCGCLWVSDHLSYPMNLTEKEINTVIEEYGQDHITFDDQKLEFYTFDIIYQNLEHLAQITDAFKDELIINDHGGQGSCDCSTIRFDKGSAIAYLLKYFNLSKKDAYAFGDGFNDQAMFREVSHRIAMGNAVDALKEKATYITTDIQDDGIMNALKHEKVI